MIITSEISRLIQAYTKDPAAAAVEATWQAPPRIPLEPGQKVQAEILAQLPDNRYLTRVAKELLVMDLPMPLQSGQTLELTFISREPAPLFALSRSANSGTPVNISDTGRQLGALTREATSFNGEISLPRISRLMDGPPTDAGILADRLRSAVSRSGVFYESHQAQWLNGQRTLAELMEEPQGTISPGNRHAGETSSGSRSETGGGTGLGDKPTAVRQPSTPAASAPAASELSSTNTASSSPSAPTGSPTIVDPPELQAAATGGEPSAPARSGTSTVFTSNQQLKATGTETRPETVEKTAIGEQPPINRQPPARAELPFGEPVRTSPTNQSAPQPTTPPPAVEKSLPAPPSIQTSGAPPVQVAADEAKAARPVNAPPAGSARTPDAPAPAAQESARAPAGKVPLPPGEAVAKFRQAGEPAPLAGKTGLAVPMTGNEPDASQQIKAEFAAEHAAQHSTDPAAPATTQPRQPGVWVTKSPVDAPVHPHSGHPADTLTATTDQARQAASPDAAMRPALEQGTAARLVDPQTLPIIREQLETLQNREFTWSGLAWPQQKMEWTIEEREPEDGDKTSRAWHTRLRLELPNLGEVSVRLRLAGNGVTVKIRGDREDSLAALRSGSEALRLGLVQAGLDLTALKVDHEKI